MRVVEGQIKRTKEWIAAGTNIECYVLGARNSFEKGFMTCQRTLLEHRALSGAMVGSGIVEGIFGVEDG